jgi:mannose-1-phosphate guanylyltransferase
VAEVRRDCLVSLGAAPSGPEVEYGWIELGGLVTGPAAGVRQVQGFQEKPPLPMAEHLFRSGSLWNTFVMAGHVDAFLEMAAQAAPGLMEVLRSGCAPARGARETRIADWVYERITPTDFSRQVLTPGAQRLAAQGLGDVEWNDVEDPERVISTLAGRGAELP